MDISYTVDKQKYGQGKQLYSHHDLLAKAIANDDSYAAYETLPLSLTGLSDEFNELLSTQARLVEAATELLDNAEPVIGGRRGVSHVRTVYLRKLMEVLYG